MPDTQRDRRENHALRRHIDCVFESGGALLQRDPIRIAFHGCTLTVQNGMLNNEGGLRDLAVAIAGHVWPNQHLRNIAIEICLAQLKQPIEPIYPAR